MTTAELDELKTALVSAIEKKFDRMRRSRMNVDEITRLEIVELVKWEIDKRKGEQNGSIQN